VVGQEGGQEIGSLLPFSPAAEEPPEKLKIRFETNPGRHPGLEWGKDLARLKAFSGKLPFLLEMERTGGEPDVWQSGGTLFGDHSNGRVFVYHNGTPSLLRC